MPQTTRKPSAKQAASISVAARQALEARRARVAAGNLPVDVTPEQVAVAGLMRERDHVEGCPVPEAVDGATRVEAFAETIIAPGPEVRTLNGRVTQPGDTVIMVRCHGCGGIRYLGDFADLLPPAAREALIDRELAKLAGEGDLEDGGTLDETLS